MSDANDVTFLLDRAAAASILGVSIPTWDQYVKDGRTPAPLRLTRRPRWLRSEMEMWIKYGCPNRQEWASIWSEIRPLS